MKKLNAFYTLLARIQEEVTAKNFPIEENEGLVRILVDIYKATTEGNGEKMQELLELLPLSEITETTTVKTRAWDVDDEDIIEQMNSINSVTGLLLQSLQNSISKD